VRFPIRVADCGSPQRLRSLLNLVSYQGIALAIPQVLEGFVSQ